MLTPPDSLTTRRDEIHNRLAQLEAEKTSLERELAEIKEQLFKAGQVVIKTQGSVVDSLENAQLFNKIVETIKNEGDWAVQCWQNSATQAKSPIPGHQWSGLELIELKKKTNKAPGGLHNFLLRYCTDWKSNQSNPVIYRQHVWDTVRLALCVPPSHCNQPNPGRYWDQPAPELRRQTAFAFEVHFPASLNGHIVKMVRHDSRFLRKLIKELAWEVDTYLNIPGVILPFATVNAYEFNWKKGSTEQIGKCIGTWLKIEFQSPPGDPPI